jgi:hypothetical protein
MVVVEQVRFVVAGFPDRRFDYWSGAQPVIFRADFVNFASIGRWVQLLIVEINGRRGVRI